MGRIIGMK